MCQIHRLGCGEQHRLHDTEMLVAIGARMQRDDGRWQVRLFNNIFVEIFSQPPRQ
jgi:hypothetical protein